MDKPFEFVNFLFDFYVFTEFLDSYFDFVEFVFQLNSWMALSILFFEYSFNKNVFLSDLRMFMALIFGGLCR